MAEQHRRIGRVSACIDDLGRIAASELADREKRKQLRYRMRGMTGRTPRWITPRAIELGGKSGCVDEHVVPLRILAQRLIDGASPAEVMSVADVMCRVTNAEDQRVSYVRTRWPDLEHELLASQWSVIKVVNLGWERYRRAGLAPKWTGHLNDGRPLLASEPCPCGQGRSALHCCR